METQTWVTISTYVGGAMAMGLGAIGSAVGEGYVAASANESISRTPELAGDIVKTMLLGQAVAESSAIFALLISMTLLFSKLSSITTLSILVPISAGLCMGLGAIGSGVGSGFPAGAACRGISRQPSMKDSLTTNMLIGSAIAQTTSIYALVIAFILVFSDFSTMPVSPTWAAMLGAAFATGLGAIGSGIGEGIVAHSACEGIARQPSAVARVTSIMLLGMAVAETTGIYGLLISMILLFKGFPESHSLAPAAALLSAGLCMGIGAIGPGFGEGLAGGKAVEWIARNEDASPTLARTMLIGQAVSESTGIYSLVIALVLIFVV